MKYDLNYLANEEGYDDEMEMLEAAALDSVVPALCTHCGYTTQLEPDGHCECPDCGKEVKSCLLIAGVI